MAEYDSLDDLKDAIEKNEGLLSVLMKDVRDAYGAQRLGNQVVENIADSLAGKGIGHYPDYLPQDQEAWVRLFKLGSSAAHILRAANVPGPEGDELVRKLLASDAEDVLRKVRELVCS